MNNKLFKQLPIILSVVSSFGVIATTLVAIKNTKKFLKYEEDINTKQFISLSKKEKFTIIKAYFKYYWPTYLVAGGTIASLTTSTILSKKIELSLTATAAMLGGTLQKYIAKTKSISPSIGKDIVKELAKDEVKKLDGENITLQKNEEIFYEKNIGFFKTTRANLLAALYYANIRLNGVIEPDPMDLDDKIDYKTNYCTSFKTLLLDAKAESLQSLNKKYRIKDIDLDFGWTNDYMSDIDELLLKIDIQEPYTDPDTNITFTQFDFNIEPIYDVTEKTYGKEDLRFYPPLSDAEFQKLVAENEMYDEEFERKILLEGE